MTEYPVMLGGIPLLMALRYAEGSDRLREFHTETAPAARMEPISQAHLEKERPYYSPGMADWLLEYNELPFAVSNALLPYGRCLFHGVAFLWRGKAWIWTAPPGTGKTTQYARWKFRYGDEVTILNGDKPLLEFRADGSVWVHPSPWKGKENIGRMVSAPLGGIICLIQQPENRIELLSPKRAAARLYRQFLYWPENEAAVDRVCAMAEQLLQKMPVWLLANRGDDDSAQLTHDAIMEWGREHEL